MPKTPNNILNRNGKSGQYCFMPDIRKTFSLLPSSMVTAFMVNVYNKSEESSFYYQIIKFCHEQLLDIIK